MASRPRRGSTRFGETRRRRRRRPRPRGQSTRSVRSTETISAAAPRRRQRAPRRAGQTSATGTAGRSAVCHRSSGSLARQRDSVRSRAGPESRARARRIGRRLVSQDGADERGLTAPFEGPLAGQHLVEDRAEREDVGARVSDRAFQLLGRHVLERPEDRALLGQRPRFGEVLVAPPRPRLYLRAPGRSRGASPRSS